MVDNTNFSSSQELAPDAEIVLFEMVTRGGVSIFFKSGPQVQYLDDLYESVPCSLTGEKRNVEGNPERPTLTIGGDDIDLAMLKPALFSGQVDGGTVRKHVVELNDLLNNNNQKITSTYRVKQVKDYNRFSISLILARFTPSASTTVPHVKYLRPAYPHVKL